MTKIKFLMSLHDQLSDLPKDEVEERLSFYSEMIEDRMEEGLSEADAVAEIGSVDEIATQITEELKKPKKVKKKLKKWEILLLTLGFPLWFPLLVAGASVAFSLYVVLWSMVVSVWAVFGAMVGSSVGMVVSGMGVILNGNPPSGVAMIGAGITCAGLAVFMFYGCKSATKGLIFLTKKLGSAIKRLFGWKEAA